MKNLELVVLNSLLSLSLITSAKEAVELYEQAMDKKPMFWSMYKQELIAWLERSRG
jgi:hypothetical protein